MLPTADGHGSSSIYFVVFLLMTFFKSACMCAKRPALPSTSPIQARATKCQGAFFNHIKVLVLISVKTGLYLGP